MAFFHTELSRDGPGLMLRDIQREEPQVTAVREVIDAAGADILVLAGLDYDAAGVALAALNAGLAQPYPHRLALEGNNGIPTGLDLDADGYLGGGRDRQAFGSFPGQSGLAILSRVDILEEEARSLNDLLWRDVPGSLLIDSEGREGTAAAGAEVQRLSSGGHWIVPLALPDGRQLTVMTFHATPPVFDGPEDRNGRRNHDEIVLWQHLLNGRLPVAPPGEPFVIAGDANADPKDGDGRQAGIRSLLADPRLRDPRPASPGGRAAADPEHDGDPALDTTEWEGDDPGNLRVDYVLPSAGLEVDGSGVLWPAPGDRLAETVAQASRHRLVWVDVSLPFTR